MRSPVYAPTFRPSIHQCTCPVAVPGVPDTPTRHGVLWGLTETNAPGDRVPYVDRGNSYWLGGKGTSYSYRNQYGRAGFETRLGKLGETFQDVFN